MSFTLCLFILLINQAMSQRFIARTNLDIDNYELYKQVRSTIHSSIGKTSENPMNLARARAMNLLQKYVPLSVKFPCNVTGFRSATPPTNVNEVRPGDIDIVGALGDSFTVGTGLVATNIVQVVVENRGLSWSIGGQRTWREYLTIPNILKEFNPNLIGFSLADSLSRERAAQFNVAEFAALSSEMPFMSGVLIERIKSDPRVDLKNHWKLITMMVGINNFCLDICFQSNPKSVLKYHRADLLTTFRLLKKSLPRTIINLVSTPNPIPLRDLKGKPEYCEQLNAKLECVCILHRTYINQTDNYDQIFRKWQKMEEEIANMDEFNTNDFAIVYQPFTLKFKLPRLPGGNVDLSYLSQDCYHSSQKLNAEAANALWNNMLEKRGNKSTINYSSFDRFLCPSEKKPYIFTKMNSGV